MGKFARNQPAQETRPLGEQSERPPRRIRLPGFLVEEEVGLGDVIKRATSWAGVKPCGACNSRAASLNRHVVFTRRTHL
jgi:hypothetical protein